MTIPEEEVARVRVAMVRLGPAELVMPWPFLRVRETVLIEAWSAGRSWKGSHLQEVKGKYRIVVSINLLQRSVSSEIDRAWVRPVKHPNQRVKLRTQRSSSS